MAWVWLDDQMPDHPKVARLTPTETWAFVAGLCYCSRMRTDGFIPSSVAWRLYSTDSADEGDEPVRVAETLVAAGLWERAEGGYAVHDYLDYQPSKEELARSHKTNRERQVRYRRHRNGVTNAVTNAVTNGVQTPGLGTTVTGTPTPNSKHLRTKKDQDLPAPAATGFAVFWDAYPKKVDKGHAETAWKALKPSQALTDLIVAAVLAQRDWPSWTKDGGKFIPNPATWLRGKRWDDDPPDVPALAVVKASRWCPHEPECRSVIACRDRTIAEAREARESA